jgi:hypothetical protein
MADEPTEDGLTGDEEFDPKNLKSARPWLAAVDEWIEAFRTYNDKCDKIDKEFANLERLGNKTRDKEMSLFWANMSVLGPSIYARPPVPVVTPRFKDKRPIVRTASEMLERAAIVGQETADIDGTLKIVRDDLARLSRGVIWQRYETKDAKAKRRTQSVCVDYKHRRDFIHDPARIWAEVDCVAAASYLTKTEMRKRFKKESGDEYKNAAYSVIKTEDNPQGDTRVKAKVWEIWSKSKRKVVWVTEGCENCLEIADVYLDLDCFFPCPRPAYGTVQPNTLIPVPDYVQYQDQLSEINELTARISALTEAVQLRAFYPAGLGEVGDAIEAAMKNTSNNVVMVPISNWAMLGDGNPNDMLVWVPIEMVTKTIAQLIELRRQIIQDVYEISGISDILRGQTDPNETLGAQELKAQTGSTRIRDKQQEMVRLARDMTRISAEIMAEEFSSETLLEMSQMEIPTDADISKQVAALEKQGKALKDAVEKEMAKPETQAMAQQQPEEAKKAMEEVEQQAQQLQGQIAKLKQTVTIEQVMKFLRDNKLRPFVLDIETDSTIVPDENAAKKQATEYVGAMTSLFQQLIPAVQQTPQLAPMAAETINYVNGVFRVGRQFEGVVEEFTEQMKQLAAQPQPKGPTPEQIKAQADQQAGQLAAQQQQMDAQQAQAEAQLAAKDLELRQEQAKAANQLAMQTAQAKDAYDRAKLEGEAAAKAAQIEADKWKAQLDSMTKIRVALIGAQSDDDRAALQAELDEMLGISEHERDKEILTIEHQHQAQMQDAAQTAAAEQAEKAEGKE